MNCDANMSKEKSSEHDFFPGVNFNAISGAPQLSHSMTRV